MKSGRCELFSGNGHAKARPYSQPPLQHGNIFPGHQCIKTNFHRTHVNYDTPQFQGHAAHNETAASTGKPTLAAACFKQLIAVRLFYLMPNLAFTLALTSSALVPV